MVSKKEIVESKKYNSFLKNLVIFLEQSRRQAAQVVNTVLTATYWETGRRIIEYEQHGKNRAAYGKELLKHISRDLNKRFGRGFSVDNLETMRLFYKAYPLHKISGTMSRKSANSMKIPSKSETVSRKLTFSDLTEAFPLSWSHYVLLVKKASSNEARQFYENEALRGGGSD
jgi:hypothetical protein